MQAIIYFLALIIPLNFYLNASAADSFPTIHGANEKLIDGHLNGAHLKFAVANVNMNICL